MAILLGAAFAAPAGAQAPVTLLTPAQFAALDAVFTTQIPLESTASAREYADARRACRALDSADPLLGPVRKACNSVLAVSRTADAFAACRTPLGCLRTARAGRIAITELLPKLRAMNRAIDAARLVPDCRTELRASKSDLRGFERIRAFLRLFQEASITGSPTLARRLDREAAALGRLSATQPSGSRERRQFRAACAPPPA